jgi:adenosylcobyric acid synthase
MGNTRAVAPVERPIGPESAAVGDVVGTYLHGLFENRTVREAFVDAVYDSAGRARPDPVRSCERSPCDAAAALVDAGIDVDALFPVG